MPSTILDAGSCSPTMAAVGDAIKAAFLAMGGITVLDDYVATNRVLVFQRDLALSKTYSLAIWQVVITPALVITQFMHTAWNSTTKVGTNSGTVGQSVTFNTNNPLNFKTFKSTTAEFDFLIVSQLLNSHILGWMRPATLNTIDENLIAAFLYWNAFASRTFRSLATGVSLLGNTTWNTLQGNICVPNHYNKNDITSKLLIFADTKSVHSITSDDIAYGAGNGLGLFAQVGDWYKVWDGGTASSSIFLK